MKLKTTLLIITALLGVSVTVSFAGDPYAKTKTAKTTAKAKPEEAIPGAAVQPAAYFYTGKPYDEDLGGYVFNYRNYAPSMNRWMTVDPSGFLDGANNYGYVANSVLTAFDADGLAKQQVGGVQVDHHVPSCPAWTRGDGGDWATWYKGNLSVFFQHLGSSAPKPTVANLAQKFVLSMLGLTAAGAASPSWTAYGGNIEWTIYKDVQPGKTIWYFNYTATEMKQYSTTAKTQSTGQVFNPNKPTGELTAVTE